MSHHSLLVIASVACLVAAQPPGRPEPASHPSSTDTALLAPEAADAVEIPAGVLYGEFTREDGPFLIMGSVVVPAGQTLKFGPGCTIFFGGEYPTLTVFGEMVAEGEPDRPVVFRSASADPKPWDWDRIYIRSRNRTTLTHCVVKHANYGVAVENGAATMEHCLFESNSLNGLVVKNADVLMRGCTFRHGHVLAVFCRPGAVVKAESLTVRDNITGIACGPKARCTVNGGLVTGNGTALAVREGASVSIVGADITRNKIGVAGEQQIPEESMEMVFGNGVNLKRVSADAMDEILKPPAAVESIVLPRSTTAIRTAGDFKPGFSALKTPREPSASFIGNVTVGFSYYHPESMEPDTADTAGTEGATSLRQTYYIGEHADTWYSGFQPDITVFAQGKRGNMDVNLNMALRANTWLDSTTRRVHKDAFTLAMNSANQSVLLGDFYENRSELSIAGRELTGFRYTAEAIEMGRGTKRLAFKLAGGESEVAKDVGFHEFDRVEEVDSGFSVHQQLTYLTSVSVKPTRYSMLAARAIVSRDQTTEPLFRPKITDPGRPHPVAAQMGLIDGNVVLLDGRLELSGELAMGAHDTIHHRVVEKNSDGVDSVVQEEHEDYDEVAWYNPQIFTRAIPRVFGLFHPDSNAYAFSLGAEGTTRGFELGLRYTEIAPHFYSAGNPYLESDRRYVALTGEKAFSKQLNGEMQYRFERASVSYADSARYSPENRNDLDLEVDYSFGSYRPTLGVEYHGRTESSEDYEYVTDTAKGVSERMTRENFEIRTGAGIQIKHRLRNGMDYRLKYRLVYDDDRTEYLEKAKMNQGDGLVNELSGRYAFRIKRIVRNKTSFKVKRETEVRDDAEERVFKVSNDLRLTLIPRKLTLNLGGAYDWRLEGEHGAHPTEYYTRTEVESEVKYSFTSRLSTTTGLRWEKILDKTPGAVDYTVLIGGLHLTYLF